MVRLWPITIYMWTRSSSSIRERVRFNELGEKLMHATTAAAADFLLRSSLLEIHIQI
jgi:hypothetical protein